MAVTTTLAVRSVLGSPSVQPHTRPGVCVLSSRGPRPTSLPVKGGPVHMGRPRRCKWASSSGLQPLHEHGSGLAIKNMSRDKGRIRASQSPLTRRSHHRRIDIFLSARSATFPTALQPRPSHLRELAVRVSQVRHEAVRLHPGARSWSVMRKADSYQWSPEYLLRVSCCPCRDLRLHVGAVDIDAAGSSGLSFLVDESQRPRPEAKTRRVICSRRPSSKRRCL